VFRALLGEKGIHLGRASTVTRWCTPSVHFELNAIGDLYGASLLIANSVETRLRLPADETLPALS